MLYNRSSELIYNWKYVSFYQPLPISSIGKEEISSKPGGFSNCFKYQIDMRQIIKRKKQSLIMYVQGRHGEIPKTVRENKGYKLLCAYNVL